MYLPRQNSESGPPEQVLVAPSDFRRFAESVLVSPKGYAGTRECPIPAELEVAAADPFAVREDFGVELGAGHQFVSGQR
jgi:hypothetical protein